MLLLLLLLLGPAASVAGALPGSATREREFMIGSSSRYLVTQTPLSGGVPLASPQTPTAGGEGESCAQACLDAAKCGWFSAECTADGVSAPASMGGGPPSYTTAAPPLLRIDNPTRLTRLQACLCDLFTPNCTLAPLVSEEAQAAGSTVTSGARKCKRNAGWRSPAQPAMHPCTPPGPAAVGYLVLVS